MGQMGHLFKKRKAVSFRGTAMLSLTVIVIPLFIAVIIFDSYTVFQEQASLRESRENTLRMYQIQWEETLEIVETFLSESIAMDSNFSAATFSDSLTNTHLAAYQLSEQCRTFLQAYDMVEAFFFYSRPYDYHRLTYLDSYDLGDISHLWNVVETASLSNKTVAMWTKVELSDRTVQLFIYVYRHTVIAAMVDPASLDSVGLGENEYIYFTQLDGAPYYPPASLGGEELPAAGAQGGQRFLRTEDGQRYELTSLPLSRDMGFIQYASPAQSFWEQLSPIQILLLAITLVLLASIPLCWLILHRSLLEPVGSLTQTIRSIQDGDTEIRVPQDSRIQEVNQIAQTVNAMLDTIRQQKIDSYEQRLAAQHAHLQYLHLQIRPHFFLNSLNLVYSLAEEEKYGAIQDLVLDLSTYLRSIFKDDSKLVTLEAELASVESYVRIQRAGAEYPPQLHLLLDAETSHLLVPPLSLLTFVENSFKHSQRQDSPLEIRIKCTTLPGEGGYLYISISDNGGGFSAEALHELNSPAQEGNIYTDQHVGISNIRHRLRLLYGPTATVLFRNLTGGACVELFLPIERDENTGGIST